MSSCFNAWFASLCSGLLGCVILNSVCNPTTSLVLCPIPGNICMSLYNSLLIPCQGSIPRIRQITSFLILFERTLLSECQDHRHHYSSSIVKMSAKCNLPWPGMGFGFDDIRRYSGQCYALWGWDNYRYRCVVLDLLDPSYSKIGLNCAIYSNFSLLCI